MAEEPDVQADEITLEDFDGEQEPQKTESSPEKAEKPEKPEEEKTPSTPPSDDSKDEAEEDSSEETEPPADKPKGAEERKTQLNTEIRDLVAQRNALKEEVSKSNSEVYQPATEKDLVDEGMDPTEAKIEALRQAMEVRDYTEKVAEAQLTIESESNRVLNDFSWANPDSPDFKKELATEAAQLLESNLITDPNTGQVIGSNISPYQLYKTLDRATGISSTEGKIEGQKATETMLANADSPGSAPPPKKSEDPLTKLWSDPL